MSSDRIRDQLEYVVPSIVGTVVTASPLLAVMGASILFIDQNDKVRAEPFRLPQQNVIEIESSDQNSRRFATISKIAGKISCPQSFVRNDGIRLTKPLLPVVRTDVAFPDDRIIFSRGAVSSNTSLDRLITCSYPESDPDEIIHIPVVREEQ